MPVSDANKLFDAYINECESVIGQLRAKLDSALPKPQTWSICLDLVRSIESASNMLGLDDIQNLAMLIQRALKRISANKGFTSGQKQVIHSGFDKLEEMIRSVPNHGNVSYRQVLNDLQKILGRKLTLNKLTQDSSPLALANLEAGSTSGNKVLLVEDNQIVARILQEKISLDGRFVPYMAHSLAECRRLLEGGGHDFFAAVLDLNLPDAPNGEVVDYVLEHSIPSMVLTGMMRDDIRKSILEKSVVDYIVKSGMSDLDYVVTVLDRLMRNRNIKVLVAEDSKVLRIATRRLLNLHCYQVLEAADGEEALEVIINNPGILVVITDYLMPNMDGLELVRAIRGKFSKQEMVVIGVSSADDRSLSAKFLKSGANDFLHKPFMEEEFHSRISQNVEMLLLFRALQESSTRDHLTKLYNRRHFIHMAGAIFDKADASEVDAVLAILDLDFFKKVNDTYGHLAGDEVLIQTAGMLKKSFENRGLVARFGGEEFILLLTGQNAPGAQKVLDVFRRHLERETIKFEGDHIKVTTSIGMAMRTPGEDLNSLIKRADQLLYQAKEAGRNQVVVG
jgi:diguanylate cyclase (GGDEF)-like protein